MNRISPPLSVRLAATLFIVCGAGSLVEMAVALGRGDFSLNLGFVGILIGRELLKGRGFGFMRGLVIVFFGLGVVLLSVVLIAAVAGSFASGQWPVEPPMPLPQLIATLVGTLFLCGVPLFGLCSSSARAWFNADPSSRIAGTEWTIPLVFAGLLFGGASSLRESMVEHISESLFPVRTRFEFRDATTGGLIKNIGWSNNSRSSERRDPLAARVSYSHSYDANGEGMTIEVFGFSGRPVELEFTSEGYQPAKYTLDRKSPDAVTLNLTPGNGKSDRALEGTKVRPVQPPP